MSETIKTLVIDDEIAFIRNIENLLKTNNKNIEIVDSARSVNEAIQKIESLKPDLIFLDIQLGDGTGFDLLRDTKFKDFQTIFVTAYDHYAIEALRLSAIDYLLKPVVSDDLWNAIDKAIHKIESSLVDVHMNTLIDNINSISSERKKIVLRESDMLHVVSLENILWCMADGSYTHFYIQGGEKVIVSQHLKEFEDLLSKNGFFRAHRSYLVNVNKITKFDKRDGGTIFLENDMKLPVAIRKKDQLLALLSKLL